ncbi:TetR/AcrR family transcriptional regulator [Sphingomonas alpina]|uniref:TetR/AcrR family transcriptional regulator n=1 Tax=Sphingomonas alpina TaxID=653931 RepID=A0A7H0LNA4_9SPHN|nr:TetR/AcrR family transcriptional regulator [Sphingomonas alpina]
MPSPTAPAPAPAPGRVKPVRRKQEDRTADTRRRILEATIGCLYRMGYSAVTIAVVAKEAGVSRGIISYHFASKADLMVAVRDAVHLEEIAADRRDTQTDRDGSLSERTAAACPFGHVARAGNRGGRDIARGARGPRSQHETSHRRKQHRAQGPERTQGLLCRTGDRASAQSCDHHARVRRCISRPCNYRAGAGRRGRYRSQRRLPHGALWAAEHRASPRPHSGIVIRAPAPLE